MTQKNTHAQDSVSDASERPGSAGGGDPEDRQSAESENVTDEPGHHGNTTSSDPSQDDPDRKATSPIAPSPAVNPQPDEVPLDYPNEKLDPEEQRKFREVLFTKAVSRQVERIVKAGIQAYPALRRFALSHTGSPDLYAFADARELAELTHQILDSKPAYSGFDMARDYRVKCSSEYLFAWLVLTASASIPSGHYGDWMKVDHPENSVLDIELRCRQQHFLESLGSGWRYDQQRHAFILLSEGQAEIDEVAIPAGLDDPQISIEADRISMRIALTSDRFMT